MVLISQSIIHLYLSSHNEDAIKVQLAGRQRTFTQEIMKSALLLEADELDPAQQEQVREELSLVFQKWENAHRALEYGDQAYSVSGENSPAVQELFREMEKPYLTIKGSVVKILEVKDAVLLQTGITELLRAHSDYEKVMGRLIFQYSQEAEAGASAFRWLELGLALLMLMGLFLGYKFMIKPVIDKVNLQTEELSILNSELENAGKVKSRFLANMSHEIRTPLQGILGLVEQLGSQVNTPEARRTVADLNKSVDKLNAMVGSLLDYSLLESGRMRLIKKSFDLHQVIEEVCESFRAVASAKSVAINMDISPEVPRTIVQDSARIKQVLLNLVSNAIKFTEHGEVVVSASLINTEEQFAQLKIAVSDTGIGMDHSELQEIFSSFNQVENEPDRSYNGLGMGLTICKDLVGLMNGHLRVDSQRGKGSTFSFSFIAEMSEHVKTETIDTSPLEGEKVIVVDGNKTNLKVIVRSLASWGMRATPFNSPELVNDTLESIDRFDMVILDLQMPELDGRALARNIRTKFERNQIKVVVLTTSAEEMLPDDEDLFDTVLHKPVKQEILLKSLLKLYRKEEPGTIGRPVDTGYKLPGNYRKLKVLIAEGNPLHQAVAERTVERLGLMADKVSTSREMFNRLNADTYDLIIIDKEMQNSSEEDPIARVRKLFDNEESSPLIFGVSDDASGAASLKKNTDDIIKKMEPQEFSDKVLHWFTED